MESVCEAAGVTKRTLYRKYADKLDLLNAVFSWTGAVSPFPEIVLDETCDLAGNLQSVTDSLLAWILEEDMLRLGRLAAEVQDQVDSEVVKLRNGLYLEQVIDSVRSALLLDRPAYDAEQTEFFAGAFLCMVAQPMYFDALAGRRSPGYCAADRNLVRRYIDLFINGWSGSGK